MSLHLGTDVLSIVEPVLLAATWCVFARKGAQRDHPAFGAYLLCRVLVFSVLTVLLHVARVSTVDKRLIYNIYYYVYWVGFLAGAGIAFLAIQEVFRHLMRPVPNLGRYGMMVFRWVSIISGLVAFTLAALPLAPNKSLLMAATGGAMRFVSTLELFLLAFIVLSMQTLQLSWRGRDFGVSLGLAMVAAADLFGSGFAFGHTSLASIANYCSAVVMVLAAGIWLIYFLQAKPAIEQQPVKLSPQLQRWDEIAGALGQPQPQIVFSASPDFFLQDVEKAVDRVLEKNSAAAQ